MFLPTGMCGDDGKERYNVSETIRNYHAVRNEVHDRASGLRMEYRRVVDDNNLEPMIDARRKAVTGRESG